MDLRSLPVALVFVLDMPLSFAFDTLLLPLDFYAQMKFDQQHATLAKRLNQEKIQRDAPSRARAESFVDQTVEPERLEQLATQPNDLYIAKFAVEKLTNQTSIKDSD